MNCTMKYYLFIMAMALCLLTACSGKGDTEQLSTDLVTNPKSASQTVEKQAVITFDKKEHDFGSLLQGEVVTYSFHFTNTGDAPLLISSVNSSCGCTVGDYPHEPIAPGKGGSIKATYDSKGHNGMQNRSLTVMSNTMPAKTVLRLKAKVMPPNKY